MALFIGRLPPSIKNYDLEDIFVKFGKITRCEVKKGKSFSYGFVEYDNMDDAYDAMEETDGMELDGVRIIVEKAKGRVRRSDERGCYNCGEEGHFARDCRQRPSRHRRSRSRSRSRGRRYRSYSRSPSRSRRYRSYSRSPSPRRSRYRSYSRSPSRGRGRRRRSYSRSVSRSPPRRRYRSYSRSPSRNGRRSYSRSPSPRRRQGSRSRSRSYSRSPSRSKSGSPKPRSPSPSAPADNDLPPSTTAVNDEPTVEQDQAMAQVENFNNTEPTEQTSEVTTAPPATSEEPSHEEN